MKFIGEIGINHNGSLLNAIKLIYLAKSHKLSMVKFQKRNPDQCIPAHMKNQPKKFEGKEMTYIEYKYKVEFWEKEYDVINSLCSSLGIEWTTSVWDSDSVEFMGRYKYDIPFLKIPSPCITNADLIKAINKTDIPVIISDGMSTVDEVDNAINSIKNLKGIFHCYSAYPSEKADEFDLNVINTYKKEYPNLEVGYSGHEVQSNLTPTIIATVLGVDYIERHITLSTSMEGSDHSFSLDDLHLKKVLNAINNTKSLLGKDKVSCYPSEEIAKEKLRQW